MTNATNSALRLLPGPEPFERAVEAFGRRLAAEGRSPSTISAYLRDLRCLTAVLSERHPGLTPDCVTSALLDEALTSSAVVISTKGTARSPASLHRFKAAVRSFFSWAEETGQVAENPARSVTLRRLPRTMPSFLTEAEKRRLLKDLRGRSSKLARRDRLIVELFLGTGIRLRELVNLDVDDVVDLDAKHLRVRPDCRKVQESGFRPEGGSRFPDEPFELSGAQARAPGVFPQPSKTAVWTQSTDIKGIKPIGRLSDSVR